MEISISIGEGIEKSFPVQEYEAIITKVLKEIGVLYGLDTEEISVLLCDNTEIHRLNKMYRQIDRPTDVLSFALNEGEESIGEGLPEHALIGDLIISLERMEEQAVQYGHSPLRELAYLTVHGCLHILGYDHIVTEDKIEMRKEEEFILEKLGYIREGQTYNE